MQQLSATDSGLLFYCDLENILDGLKDFSRPRQDSQEGEELSEDGGSGETSMCYVSLEEARSSNRMALAALKAKNKVVEELSLEAVILREDLMRERVLRRAAEAADEDQSFLREQMETILKEKARLAQENARLVREGRTMAKELEILGVQLEKAASMPKRVKEVEKKLKNAKTARTEAEERAESLESELQKAKQTILSLQQKMDDERENWKTQERALLNYASKQKMFQADMDDSKQGLAMVTHSKVLGAGGKSKRVILAELEDMSVSTPPERER
ncbi:hypothetical protein HOP50_04g28880 [Chloropicon primus]|uniref:Uncharacterized protein n=1 Tax=Chloropicon primus TaxID=1764295 RepID=A0A5B8MJB7_9CHLO|nr:hypothetical protein A3770_04p28890 [Chloropicon primus]UPQ99580.1 hypothetical protein HOP50_04g28880 [Chloropicon primus]|eukprot:QDZ20371.1 hypothetical protein A3770_04p28890 [Chloropicon primus]